MRLIGLCGKSASGKGCFASLAKEEGITVIDCDEVYKNLVSYRSECLNEIEANFGSSVISNDSLNRRVLAPIVFGDAEKLALLNSITHCHILKQVESILAELPDDSTVILDAPTLFESGLDEKCDAVIAVIASDDVCVSRIVARDGISETDARARISNQKSNEFYFENCDIIIYNDSNLDDYVIDSLAVIKALKEVRV